MQYFKKKIKLEVGRQIAGGYGSHTKLYYDPVFLSCIQYLCERNTTRSIVDIRVKHFQTEKSIEIQLDRPTKVCAKE